MFSSRVISITELPGRGLAFLKLLPRLFIVKQPFTVLRHYIKRDSPGFIDLKSGFRILLSSHPHDIVTFFVVFLRKDYGDVERDSVVIDVGANIGMFSLFAALSGAKQVYAFEPSREAFRVLCENIRLNEWTGTITPINRAVTDRDNTTVKFPISSSPYNRIASNDIGNPDDYFEVETVTLSSFIVNNNIHHIDLLKLDCEGAEFDILPSMNKSELARISRIRMECHGESNQLIEELSHKGFVVERMKSSGIWLKRCSA